MEPACPSSSFTRRSSRETAARRSSCSAMAASGHPSSRRSSRSSIPGSRAAGGTRAPARGGGGEYGEAWHQAGMRRRKQNVFDDFIAASEYLIQNGYTRPDRFVIQGASNGGILVGAAITQRPELYRAAICGVPIIDMLRYHLVGGGKTWIEEFGSVDDPEDFKVLYAY